MWLHTPELSINLNQVLRVIPKRDAQGNETQELEIVQPDNITVTVSGVNAAAVCHLLATQPGGHLNSWLGKRINIAGPATPAAPEGSAGPA